MRPRFVSIIVLIIIAICFGLLVFGCSHEEGDRCTLTKMKSPVTIVAISENGYHDYNVILKDSTGEFLILGSGFYTSPLAQSIGQSRHVGDTIK